MSPTVFPATTLGLAHSASLASRGRDVASPNDAAPLLASPGSGEQVGVCLDVEGGGGGAGHREVADQHQPALNLRGDIKKELRIN